MALMRYRAYWRQAGTSLLPADAEEAPLKTRIRPLGYQLVRGLPLLVGSTIALWGQLYTGSLTGTVIDPAGAVVMGAKVTLTDADRSTRTKVNTDGSGRYLFRSLSPGNYSIQVDAAGFELFDLRNIAIEVNGSLSTDARLRLSARRESVLVEATPL